jgi:dienelactone hydrolase
MAVVALDLDDSEGLRQQLRSFLDRDGFAPAPRVEVLSSSAEEGFSLQRVNLVTDDDTIPSLLAVPHGEGPFPAVVVFHQHAGQRHLGKSEVFGLAGDPHQAFGPELARAGRVVLAPDSIAFEDRRPAGPGTDQRDDDWEQHYNAMTYRLVAGDMLMRKVLDDSAAAISALMDRTDVDPANIAVLGHSYGGNTSLFLAAVDDRVTAGCASGALASYRRKIEDGTGIEMAEVIPGFTSRFDMRHLLAAIAPRPFLIVSATEDKYSIDADAVIEAASPAGTSWLEHMRVVGGHGLDATRFHSIVDWTVRSTAGPTT